jgi:AcrR family transcriptional regulator
LSREEKKAQTRTRLLEAAGLVFARKGVAEASLDDIAAEAGLTKGAVYSNFASKEDLINALLDHRLGAPSDAIPHLIDSHAPQADQASEAGRLFMSLIGNERDAYLLEFEFMLYLARHPEARDPERYLARRNAMAGVMASRAAEAGVTLPLPAEDLTAALFALGQGIALERLINPEAISPDLFGKILGIIFVPPTQPARGAPPGRTRK